MFGSALWVLVALLGLAGSWVCVNGVRLSRQVARDARSLLAASQPRRPALERLASLPPPVQRYLRLALGSDPAPVYSLRFRHGGRFRTRLDGPWHPIRGEQYDSVDPPGFIWWGRLSAAPGVWIDACDRAVAGKGEMRVSLLSSVTLFDRVGPQLDQGAMLRLLSDFVLFPGLLLDERYVSWCAVDARHARATLRLGGASVSGTFEFGEDGLARSFSAQRYLDSGAGEAKLLPWSGDYEDYRSVNGLLVPHHFIGYWHVAGERIAYVDFVLETPEYDVREPY